MKKALLFLLSMFVFYTSFSQVRILTLGESTTDFGPSYRRKLCQLLTNDAVVYDMVGPKDDGATTYDGDHAGYSGNPASSVQAQLVSFYSTIPADIILIWEGTNDCGWATVGGSITPLSNLVDKCSQLYPNAEILVGSIPPMSYTAYESVEHGRLPGVAAANAVIYNNAMPVMCSTKVAEGKKVHFVDATSLTLADVSSDGIHPNQTGYDKMGTIFYNAVKLVLAPTPVSSVGLPATALIATGSSTTLTATVLPNNATNKSIVWSSNNAAATVDASGIVTGVSVGTATITATSSDDATKKATCVVTVTAPAAVSGVVLPATANVYVGLTTTLTATVSPTNSIQTVTWSSNNAAATVNASGVVTGVSVGTATITATSTADGTKLATCTVSIIEPPKKYEAENATLSGGTKANTNHTGYSGTGFVDGNESVGTSTLFNINVSAGGTYNVTLRYCNSMGSTRTLSLYVNGVKIKQTSLINLASWDTWGDQTESLTLNAGANTIAYKYEASDNGFVNLDYINIVSPSASVASVTLPATATVAVGSTLTLTATILPDAAVKTLVWSSNSASATVSSSGVVIGVSGGTAIITATSTENSLKKSSCTVTITAAAVSSVGLTATASIAVGATKTLIATVLPGTAVQTVTWSSNNASATVSATGVVTGVAAGTATITATSTSNAAKKATCVVTVTSSASAVNSVSLPSTATVAVGLTKNLTATVLPANAIQTVTWISNNANTTVNSSGVITGISIGTSIITATSTTDGTKQATCIVTVTATADVQAPSVPTGLVVDNLSITTTSFSFSWVASTDNVAVTGYDVYKNGDLVGSTTTTSYSFTGLTPATIYSITVKAKDASNNISASSNYLGITTLSSLGLLNTKNEKISIYPNPVEYGILNINFNNNLKGRIELSLYNLLGSLVYTIELDSDYPVSITLPSSISKGIYLLKTGNETTSYTNKISIE